MNAKELSGGIKAHCLLKGIGSTVAISSFFVAYFIVLRNPVFPVQMVPVLEPDHWVPVVSWSMWIYFSLWLYVCMPHTLMREARPMGYYLLGAIVLAVLGLLAFVAWPTAVPEWNIDWNDYPSLPATFPVIGFPITMKAWFLSTTLLLKISGLALVLMTDHTLLGCGVLISGILITLWHFVYPRSQGICDTMTGFAAAGRQVWLTIDDGPDRDDTPKILDLLDQFGAKATFFMIGERAARCPELVREVLARGHEVGCHTFTHPLASFWCASRYRVCRELDDNLAVLEQAGAEVRFFRPPAGIRNVFLQRCLQQRHLTCVAWTVRSGDGTSRCLEKVVQRVLRKVRPGSIIMMHEGKTVALGIRVEAMRRVLIALHKREFSCIVPLLHQPSRQ